MMRNKLIAAHGILERKDDAPMIGKMDIPIIMFVVLVIALAVYGFWG